MVIKRHLVSDKDIPCHVPHNMMTFSVMYTIMFSEATSYQIVKRAVNLVITDCLFALHTETEWVSID